MRTRGCLPATHHIPNRISSLQGNVFLKGPDHASVHQDGLSCHVAVGRRGEEGGHPRELFGRSVATQGYTRLELRLYLLDGHAPRNGLRRVHALRARRGDPARWEGVDEDAVGGELDGEVLGQPGEAGPERVGESKSFDRLLDG